MVKNIIEINGRQFEIVERKFKDGFSGEFLRVKDLNTGNISKCDISYAYKNVQPQGELYTALREVTKDNHQQFLILEAQDVLQKTKRKKSGPYIGVSLTK